MATQYKHSLFASSWCLPIPLVTPHVRKKRKRNIQMNFEGNSAQSHYVLFLEIRNAQGGTSIVSWKRSKRKIRVCFLCFLFPVFRLRPYFQVNSRCISPFYGEIKHWSAQRGVKKKNNSQVYDNGNGHVFFCGSEAELEEADRRYRPNKWPFPGIFPNRTPRE